MRPTDRDIEVRRNIVGQYLKRARIRRGFTQERIAQLLKYTTPQFISNWERGLSQPPFDVLPELALHYEIPPDELIRVLTGYQEELLKRFKKDLGSVFK